MKQIVISCSPEIEHDFIHTETCTLPSFFVFFFLFLFFVFFVFFFFFGDMAPGKGQGQSQQGKWTVFNGAQRSLGSSFQEGSFQ